MSNIIYGSRFFGRRKGRPLSSNMKILLANMLPDLRFDLDCQPSEQFGRCCNSDLCNKPDLILEIGFGGGEHLASLAENSPQTNFIGAEPFVNGVASLLRHIKKRDLSNIRIWDDDVRLMLPRLSKSSLASVYIMFPDPWPKKRHLARRILDADMIEVLADLIKPRGNLVLASDDKIAKKWLLQTAISHPKFFWTAREPKDWRQRPLHIFPTRYMVKAENAGRCPSWFVFERIPL